MKRMKRMKRCHQKSTFSHSGSGSYGTDGVDGVLSLWSLWIYQLGIPLITPEPYIQPWMGQYKNHFIQNKTARRKKKPQDHAEQKGR